MDSYTYSPITSIGIVGKEWLQNWWQATATSYSHDALLFGGSYLISIVAYFGLGLLHLILDLSWQPSWLYRYKIQPNKHFSPGDVSKLFKTLIINFFVVTPALLLVTRFAVQHRWIDCPHVSSELPSMFSFVRDLALIVIIEEILFYYSHRLLHLPYFYRRVHKKHHEFTSPVALAAAYAHWFEMIVSNLIPTSFGAYLIQTHMLTFWCWMVLAIVGTQVHHCGFRFPWIPFWDHNPNFHDMHHQKFECNYGLLGILDKLHSTSFHPALKTE